MEQTEQHLTQGSQPFSSHLPSPRLGMAALLLVLGIAALLVWGGGPTYLVDSNLPTFRYVNSGWVSPVDWEEVGPFATELRAFVLTNQEELEAFEDEFISKRSYGNSTSLGRIEFDDSVLLAAYYVWRPTRGDPLSVADLVVDGNQAAVRVELDIDPQGREYPYLFAPMVMVSTLRARFPEGEPVDFVFELNGHPPITLTATPNP